MTKLDEPIIMRLRNGRLVDVTNLHVDDVDIYQIAHSLSLLCRFVGQLDDHYSVAQHSAYVANVARQLKHTKHIQLHALLHDAAEAFIGDLASPIKRRDQFYQDLERSIDEVVRKKFNLTTDSFIPKLDEVVTLNEQRDLQGVAVSPWHRIQIRPMSALEAEIAFLRKYFELTGTCNHCSGSGHDGCGELCSMCGSE